MIFSREVYDNFAMDNLANEGGAIRRVRDEDAPPSLGLTDGAPARYGSFVESPKASIAVNDENAVVYQSRPGVNDNSSHFVADTSNAGLVREGDEYDEEEAAEQGGMEAPVEREMEDSAGDHPTTSLTRTFINFVKANLGTGILAMPDAIKNGGLYFGTVGLLLLGCLTCYSSHMVLRAYVQVSDGKPISLGRVVELVFRKAPGRVRKFSKVAYSVISAWISMAQLGFLCVYILFVAKMVKEVVDSQTSAGPSIVIYETVVVALLIPFCWVTTLKALSLFNLFANVVSVLTIIVVMQYVFRNLQVVENVPWIAQDLGTLPLFFGTALFSFESIGLILPIENRMKERREFHGWNGLFTFSLSVIIVMYAAVGFYGYLAFGADSKMILSNMPPGDWLYSSLKLMYGLSIFLSFNLQLYVPVQIIVPPLKEMINRPWFDRFGEYIMRTIFVLGIYALAVSVPCLEYMISLFGCLSSSFLAFILPPILNVVCTLHKGHRHRFGVLLVVKNVLILLIGLFGLFIGTFTSIQAIAVALSTPGGCGN